MTKDDIIRMALEAGLRSAVLLHMYGNKEAALCDSEIAELRQLEAFANFVAGMEREEILKMSRDQWFKTQADFEKAIEARWKND